MPAIYESLVHYDDDHDLYIQYGVQMHGDKVDYFIVHGVEVFPVTISPEGKGAYRIQGERMHLMDEVEFLVMQDLVETVSYGLEPTAKLERILRREV